DHTEREIDSRRKAASGCEVVILDEARASLELNVRKLHGKTSKRAMIRGRRFAVQKSGFCQDKCTCADRHGDVGGFRRFSNPFQYRWARWALRGNDNYLWQWGVLNRVIGNNLHSAAGADRFLRFGHRVQTKWHVLPTRNHRVLKNFPRPAKI